MTFDLDRDDAIVTKKPPYIITPATITVILEGESHVVASSHPNHALLLDAIKEEDWEASQVGCRKIPLLASNFCKN